MNPQIRTRHNRSLLLVTLLVPLVATGPAWAEHQGKPIPSMKGAEQLQHLTRPDQGAALKPGDTVAMACTKCRNITVVQVESAGRCEFVKPGTRHDCAMCGGTVEVTQQKAGSGKRVKHKCSHCGKGSAYCCATRPGSKPSDSEEAPHKGHHEPAEKDPAEPEPKEVPEQKQP